MNDRQLSAARLLLALLAPAVIAPRVSADSAIGGDTLQGSMLNPSGYDPTLAPDPRGKATMLPALSRTPSAISEAWSPHLATPQSSDGNWPYQLSAEAGVIAPSTDTHSAQFDPYTDRQAGPWLHTLNFRTEQGARHFELDAGEVGRRDQYYRAGTGEYGTYRLNGFFSEIPHRIADDVRSVFRGTGTGNLTLLPGLVPGGSSSAQIASALQSALPSDLGTARRRMGFDAELAPGGHLSYFGRYSHEARKGDQPFGGSLLFPDLGLPDVVETIEPIDYKTHDFQAGVRWESDLVQASLGYNGSFFRNANKALIWQSPFSSSGGAPVPQARFALPPNNDFHNLKLDLGGSLPVRGNFNGTLSWARMSQNDALLPPTIRTGRAPDGTNFDLWNSPAALSQQSANARIDTRLAQFGVSLSPLSALTLRAKLRHYAEDNKTAYTAFNPQTGQYGYVSDDGGMAFLPFRNSPASLNTIFVPFGVFSPVHYRSIPFAYTRNNASVDADYRLFAKNTVSAGYEREDYHRDYRERSRTWEDRVRLGLSNRAISWATLRLSYEYAYRSGSAYNSDPYQQFYIGQGQTAVSPPYTLANMRKFDLADRWQRKFKARANFVLREDMDLMASTTYSANKYGADYGRTRDRNLNLGLDWQWSLRPGASMYANVASLYAQNGQANINDADSGASGSAAAGGSVYPLAGAWSANSTDITRSAGFGGRYANSRWAFDSHYAYARSTTRVDYGYASVVALTGATALGAGSSMPDIVFRQHILETSLKYTVNRNIAIRAFHRYDNSHIVDWHYDHLPQLLPTELFLGSGPRSYHAHTIGVVLQYASGH
jgi:hypothetical protein